MWGAVLWVVAAALAALPVYFTMAQAVSSLTMLLPNLRKSFAASHASAHPTDTMRAAQYATPGPPSVIDVSDTVPRPVPARGQMLVRVRGAGVNPVDFKFRRQPMPEWLRPMPKILCFEMAGVVVECPAPAGGGEPRFRPGEHVVAMVPYLMSRWGTAAEFVAVDPAFAALAPRGWTPTQAAALPLVGLTVVQALAPAVESMRRAGGTEGKRALVQAGAGGVGSFAIQYCKRVLGMHVTATCSAGNAAWVMGLGADATHDYTTAPFDEALAGGFDVVLDPMVYAYRDRSLRSPTLLKRGYWSGHYVHITSTSWDDEAASTAILPTAAKVLGSAVTNSLAVLGLSPRVHGPTFVAPDGDTLARIVGYIDGGLIRPVVEEGSVFGLDGVRAAHERIETGHVRGKLAIRTGELDEY